MLEIKADNEPAISLVCQKMKIRFTKKKKKKRKKAFNGESGTRDHRRVK